MPDEDTAAAVEALETVLIGLIEHAHELAVIRPPEAAEGRRERIGALRQVATDMAVLWGACAVLERRIAPPGATPRGA